MTIGTLPPGSVTQTGLATTTKYGTQGEINSSKIKSEAEATEAGPLNGGSYGKPIKRYFPSELGQEQEHGFIQFVASKEYKFMRKDVSTTEKNANGELTDVQAQIFLPLPNNIATAYRAAYETAGIGAFGVGAGNFLRDNSLSSILDISSEDINSEDIKGTIKKLGLAGLSEIAKGAASGAGAGALVGAVFKGLAGGITGGALGAAAKGGFAGAGVAVNPYLAQIFQGVDLREHNFQYKLVAKNEQESKSIVDIINVFKYHMLPAYRKSNHFFSYPEQFDIIIKFPGVNGRDYAFDIGASVLTDFSVNYTGENGAYFFESGAPISVIISMKFQESTITTKEDIATIESTGEVSGLGQNGGAR